MKGIPGREGLEPQFRVGDRVEFGFNGEKKTGTVTGFEIDNPFVTISGDDGDFYAISSSVKLLPQLMICPKADKSCVCTHKEPHERGSTWFACDGVCWKHGERIACIPYVDEQMVDILPLITTLQRESGVLAPVYLQPRRVQQRTLRAILAPYMEGSNE